MIQTDGYYWELNTTDEIARARQLEADNRRKYQVSNKDTSGIEMDHLRLYFYAEGLETQRIITFIRMGIYPLYGNDDICYQVKAGSEVETIIDLYGVEKNYRGGVLTEDPAFICCVVLSDGKGLLFVAREPEQSGRIWTDYQQRNTGQGEHGPKMEVQHYVI